LLQTLLARDDIPQDIRKVIIDEISEREALEAELHEIKSKYITITNSQLIGNLIYQDQHIVEVNDTHASLIGYDKDEFLSFTFNELTDKIHPEDRPGVIKAAEDFIRGKPQSPKSEYRLIHKNGGIVWVEAYITLIDYQGKRALHSFIIDITDRKKAEEKLRASEARLEKAQEIAHIGSWEWNVKTNDLIWSTEIFRIFGLKHSEFEGTYEAFLELIHPDDRELVKKSVNDALAEIKPYNIEHRIIRPEGEERIVVEIAEVFHDKFGEPSSMIGTVHDITDRKQAENAVKESEKKYRSLINNIPAVTWISDKKGATSFISSNVEQIYGFSPQEILESSSELWFDRIHREDIDRVQEMYENHFINNLAFDIEYRIQRKDGNWIWLHDKAVEQFEVGEEHLSYGVFMDVTSQKEMEEKLKTSEAQFRQYFQEILVPQLEFDLSDVKLELDHLKKTIKGINLISYLDKHPEEFMRIIRKTKFVQGNFMASKIINADINQIEGKKQLRDIMEAHGYRSVKNMVIALLEGKKSLETGIEEYLLNGNQVYLLQKLILGSGSESTWRRMFNAFLDVTDLVKAETSIRESEEKLRGILINSQDGIFLTDEQERISEWNTSMELFTGLKLERIKGRSLWDIFNVILPTSLQLDTFKKMIEGKINQVFKKGITEGVFTPFEMNIQSRGGKIRFLQISLFIVPKKQDFLIGGICRDQTQMHQVETRMMKEVLRYNIEDGSIYLIKEQQPLLVKDIFNDLLQIGYKGSILSRTSEKDYTHSFIGEITHIWLSKQRLLKGSTLIDHVVSEITQSSPRSVILIDSLDYLVKLYSSKDVVTLISNLRDIAIIFRHVILISVDPDLIPEKDLKFLEKETKGVEPRSISKMSTELFELLKYIYFQNNLGVRPSYTQIVDEFETTRPTARKRVRELLMKAYVRETSVGRTKVFELTQKGINLFLSS